MTPEQVAGMAWRRIKQLFCEIFHLNTSSAEITDSVGSTIAYRKSCKDCGTVLSEFYSSNATQADINWVQKP